MDIDWSSIKSKKFLVNFLFHSTILFTILSIFFFVIIAPLTTKTINGEFSHLIHQNIKTPEIIEQANYIKLGYFNLMKDFVDPEIIKKHNFLPYLEQITVQVDEIKSQYSKGSNNLTEKIEQLIKQLNQINSNYTNLLQDNLVEKMVDTTKIKEIINQANEIKSLYASLSLNKTAQNMVNAILISKLEELTNQINEIKLEFTNLLQNIMKQYLISPSKIIGKLDNVNPLVKVSNDGLKSTLITANVFTWCAIIILILLTTKYNCCNDNIDFKFMFWENIITFIFVGIVEFLFFKMIASKFVPIEPSFISKETLNRVKNMFN